MAEYPLNQSSWGRARQDTISAQKTTRFMWGGEGVLAVAGGAWLAQIAPLGAPTLEIVVRSVIGGLGGLLTAILIIFVWNLFRAPSKQRDEARNMVEQQREPSDREVNDAIGLLEAETLVLKNNEEEESSYSFSQIFLAIADRLSIGVLFNNNLENYITKGLGLGECKEWFFPYEHEGITHLIGVLYQNALIERHNEEYQHMTRELVSGQTGIYLTPDAHLVKNTEVKYYLSSLGSRVIQQLRQQSTVQRDNALKIEVSKCYFAKEQLRPLETLILIIELTVRATSIPIDLASLQLCIGTDKIDPITPMLPVTVVNSPSSYLAKYDVAMLTLIEGGVKSEAGRILTFATGQEWLSDAFQIPYDSPLLPQEVT